MRVGAKPMPVSTTNAASDLEAAAVLTALGGRANLLQVESLAGRVAIRAARIGDVDETALAALGVRGVVRSGDDSLQLLVPGNSTNWLNVLRS